jgi:IclR family acetate operon transcriptional repressor
VTPVRSVERAISILTLVAEASVPIGLSEVSRATGLDKATTLRLLLTLENANLIQRDALSRRYSPAAGLWRLVNFWRHDLRLVSMPHLESLRRSTGETVQLVCPRGVERVVVEALAGAHELVVVPSVGTVQPIYVGASGKTIMAFLPDEERDRIIELTGLKPLNPLGIADRATYLDVLRDIRMKGYAESIGDVTIGACALAAPVFDASGRVVAAVSLRGPEIRMGKDRLVKMAPLVMETARSISSALGYQVKQDVAV